MIDSLSVEFIDDSGNKFTITQENKFNVYITEDFEFEVKDFDHNIIKAIFVSMKVDGETHVITLTKKSDCKEFRKKIESLISK